MTVLPEDYLVDVSADDDRSLCASCLTAQENADHWILGDAFMRGWYNIHDHENKRMGFVPFLGSNKSAPIPGQTPVPNDRDDDKDVDDDEVWTVNDVLLVTAAVAAVGGITFLVLKLLGIFAAPKKALYDASKVSTFM